MEEKKEEVTEVKQTEVPTKKKKNMAPIIIPIVFTFVIAIGVLFIFLFNGNNKEEKKDDEEEPVVLESQFGMSDNTLSKFDISFLKFENNGQNKIYSPLSIKYALAMLSEGSKGNTKGQIDAVIGKYEAHKYNNNSNMSFANALFINDSEKDGIKSNYIDTLKEKYNAEIITDSFEKPDAINNWVSKKTFGLIEDIVDDVSDKVFVLVNALAIDMEWVNKIQPEWEDYYVSFKHRKFWAYVPELNSNGFSMLDFNNNFKAESVQIAAVANRYDIVKDIGEDNIRNTVGKEYRDWLKRGECEDPIPNPSDKMINDYLDEYIEEIGSGYNQVSSSTDFEFYDDEKVKVFAKDLKTYEGTTLQYIGIMPKKDSLTNFINDMSAEDINNIIGNIKKIELDSFEDGYITEIKGLIPTFNFEYELKLMDDLKSIGIVDAFDSSKADLSKITGGKGLFIDSASHKANIEFSNDGIKAGAATTLGGKGNYSCEFDYIYDVPVKTIDLTFDSPYLFLIRDKDTKEVWFVGTVYEPNAYKTSW